MMQPSSELIIDYELVRHNINIIRNHLPQDSKFMGIVKSNGYGHDLDMTTKALEPSSVSYLSS